MGLYEMLFLHKQVSCSQILLTDQDFLSQEKKENLRSTISTLLSLGIVPVLNENDVISTRKTPIRDENNAIFWDNDSLAALVSKELSVDLMILLSDVEGLYKKMPGENQRPEIIHTYVPGSEESSKIAIGTKSRVGRGGMQAKIDAAVGALQYVKAVVVASGYNLDTIKRVLKGELVGTLFTKTAVVQIDEEGNHYKSAIEVGSRAKAASRSLLKLSSETRKAIVHSYADILEKSREEIMRANIRDLDAAAVTNLAESLLGRLKLTTEKLTVLANGLRQIADAPEPLGRVQLRREIANGLVLEKVTVGLGVLLIIFESRPDALPQIAGLAIRSGNGLILKGGKEAFHTNRLLHALLLQAISLHTTPAILDGEGLVSLLNSREEVEDLLREDDLVDLVIPRGGASLVQYVKEHTKIPVLGHSEGICHLFVHRSAKKDVATALAVDAKTDYPSACNACETLLLDEGLPVETIETILSALRAVGVKLVGGPRASKDLGLEQVQTLKTEHGDLTLSVEIVRSVEEAIDHVNRYGSSHTDSIVCEDQEAARKFVEGVDSACAFVNASTRFADGYRFGLGAEVGVSTSRIHARGPVGIDGLLSSKWILRGTEDGPHAVSLYSSGKKKFSHRDLPIRSSL
eukprot:TRINITY_DN4316_c0_g2_i2.p1 TRINITY_DN4316_c0_g2~~TRINITY_DN4316_c0_g2_i2.p1  ORF type:complete len:633 (-),score=137.13 TRINITY_DN4316_c0_g2_i2:58-1956(-)